MNKRPFLLFLLLALFGAGVFGAGFFARHTELVEVRENLRATTSELSDLRLEYDRLSTAKGNVYLSREEINDVVMNLRDTYHMDRLARFYANLMPEDLSFTMVPAFDAGGDRVLQAMYQSRVVRRGLTAEQFRVEQRQRGLYGPKSRKLYAWMKEAEQYGTASCGREELTYMVISASFLYDIPTNVLFALIWAESGFNPRAYNDNGGRSNDAGLMQLNSRVFPKTDRYNVKENLRAGCLHLKARYEQYGSWDAAIARYNGSGDRALRHLARVLKKERELDRMFCLEGFQYE